MRFGNVRQAKKFAGEAKTHAQKSKEYSTFEMQVTEFRAYMLLKRTYFKNKSNSRIKYERSVYYYSKRLDSFSCSKIHL